MRTEYSIIGLDEYTAGDDPIAMFGQWLDEVITAGLHEANAMAVATVSAGGRPSVRTVLAKGFDADGLVFFTNYESRKGHELQAHPRAAAVMLWHSLQRQIRVEGAVTRLSVADSDGYFHSRPRGAQIGAVASPQSQPVADRAALEELYERAAAEAGDGVIIRPDGWGGYRIAFEIVEFWQGRANRMHDRIRFERLGDGGWRRDRLAP